MKNYTVFKDGFFYDPLFFSEKIKKFEFDFNLNVDLFKKDNFECLYLFDNCEIKKINEFSIYIKYKNISFLLDPFFYEDKNYKFFKADYLIFSGEKKIDFKFIELCKDDCIFHMPFLNKKKFKNCNFENIKEYTWWQSSIFNYKNQKVKLTCLPRKKNNKSEFLWSNWILELDNFKILFLSKNESVIYLNQIEKEFKNIDLILKN